MKEEGTEICQLDGNSIGDIRALPDSQNLKIACFDLEGTLVEGSVWRTLNKAFGVPESESRDLFNSFLEGTIDYRNWVDSLKELWVDSECVKPTRENIIDICGNFDIISGADRVLEKVRKEGYIPISISGAPEFYSERVARKLGIKINIPTHRFVFDGGDEELHNIEILNDYDFSKSHILKWLKERKNPERIVAFGDDINDLDMCKEADVGFLVDNDFEPVDRGDIGKGDIHQISFEELSKRVEEFL